jgi:chromosome segregation ATPase
MLVHKPISQQLDDSLHRRTQGFSGAVAPIEFYVPETGLDSLEPVEGPTQQVRNEPQGGALERLCLLNPKNEAVRKKVHRTIGELTAVLSKVAELEAACDAERNAAFKLAHRDVRAQGRELLGQIAKLQARGASLLREFNEAVVTRSHATEQVRFAEYSRQRMSKWADDSEIAKSDAAIVEARKQLHEATSEWSQLMTAYNANSLEESELRKNLAKLETDEARLRGAMSGKPYFDPELRLSTAPLR